MFFFFFFYCLFGDGGFASIESPSSESSDSSDGLLASGSKGRGGGEAESWGAWEMGSEMIYLQDGRGIGMHIAKWAIHIGGKLGWAGVVDLYKGFRVQILAYSMPLLDSFGNFPP